MLNFTNPGISKLLTRGTRDKGVFPQRRTASEKVVIIIASCHSACCPNRRSWDRLLMMLRSMTACWHWIINCSIFQGSDSPGKDTLRTPLQILACRFPVLDTIGLGLALSWRIAAVCPWQECFPKKYTSRGSNSDNISDRVLPWLRASSPVEYYSWMPRSVSLHFEVCVCVGGGGGGKVLGLSPDFKKKKKKKRMWHTPKLLANIIISQKISGL